MELYGVTLMGKEGRNGAFSLVEGARPIGERRVSGKSEKERFSGEEKQFH